MDGTEKRMQLAFLQLFLELFNFLLKLAEQCILWIFINSSFVFDVLGPVGISQSADCLIIVVVCWANVCTLRYTKEFI